MSRRHISAKFDEIVDFSGVEQFIDVPVKRYSSGMYVRLAFAVAAHLEPEVLVVDEVLAVGDAQFQAKCIGKLGEVARTGRTVLFVSHNMSAIKELCQRIILLRAGRLHSDGSGDNVIAEYLSEASVSGTGDFDLELHPARAKKHAKIIRSLSLRTADGNAASEFLPNTDLHINLVLRSDSVIVDPRVAIAIEDAYARRIFTVASYFGDCNLPELCGSAEMRCCIPRLPLGPGRYLVSVSVADKHQHLLDSVDCAAWFQVGWQNSYGNGERYLPVYGPVLHESIWRRTC
jgi:lipopolysaccharide transport system ATP-binding protein